MDRHRKTDERIQSDAHAATVAIDTLTSEHPPESFRDPVRAVQWVVRRHGFAHVTAYVNALDSE